MMSEEKLTEIWLDKLADRSEYMGRINEVIEAEIIRKKMLQRRIIIEKEIEKKLFETESQSFKKLESKLKENGFLKVSLSHKLNNAVKKNFKPFSAGIAITYLISLAITVETITYRGINPTPETQSKEESQINDFSIELSEKSNEPYALANAIQSKAWAAGLETFSIPEADGINLYIKNMSEDTNQSDLKMELGINTKTNGTVKLKILKNKIKN